MANSFCIISLCSPNPKVSNLCSFSTTHQRVNLQLYPPTNIPTSLNRNIIISMKKPTEETNYHMGMTTRNGSFSSAITPIHKLDNNENLATPLCTTEQSVKKIESSLSATESTLGRYLARRLVQIGVDDVFGVPGDSNLSLLDQLIAEPRLNLVGCCNELNAGYAADGYARSRGMGACVFTFTVGGLSAINAIAGAYSENIPLICIIGGPNSNYYSKNVILHHTIGLEDFSQELRCFKHVTCYQAVVTNLEDAKEQIDKAFKAAISERKPVYIHISSNLASISHPSFSIDPITLFLPPRISDPMSLDAAVETTITLLNKAVNPVLIGGAKLRVSRASEAFLKLANASGYAMAIMPAAKGLVPEDHPQFIGTYWGPAGDHICATVVESADVCLYVGPIFDDISSLGFSTISNKDKMIVVHPERVVIGNRYTFVDVLMNDFLLEISKRIGRNTTSYENYRMVHVPQRLPLPPTIIKDDLKVYIVFEHIQKLLTSGSVVISEAGDSWFRTQELKLPQGCRYEVQLLYASIGWSVGATLGYAQAAPHRRVIACIGDGSFQMSAQEVSTMLRCGQRSIIFLINNGGYSTEIPMSDGPYNEIKNWDYTKFLSAIDNKEDKCWTSKVHNEEELVYAIEKAMGAKADKLCFIEVIVDKHDTSNDLAEFGRCLAAANSTSPTGSHDSH